MGSLVGRGFGGGGRCRRLRSDVEDLDVINGLVCAYGAGRGEHRATAGHAGVCVLGVRGRGGHSSTKLGVGDVRTQTAVDGVHRTGQFGRPRLRGFHLPQAGHQLLGGQLGVEDPQGQLRTVHREMHGGVVGVQPVLDQQRGARKPVKPAPHGGGLGSEHPTIDVHRGGQYGPTCPPQSRTESSKEHPRPVRHQHGAHHQRHDHTNDNADPQRGQLMQLCVQEQHEEVRGECHHAQRHPPRPEATNPGRHEQHHDEADVRGDSVAVEKGAQGGGRTRRQRHQGRGDDPIAIALIAHHRRGEGGDDGAQHRDRQSLSQCLAQRHQDGQREHEGERGGGCAAQAHQPGVGGGEGSGEPAPPAGAQPEAGPPLKGGVQLNTTVLAPCTSTRLSRCQRNPRESTRRSMSRPWRTMSATSSAWLTRITSCSTIGPASRSAVT